MQGRTENYYEYMAKMTVAQLMKRMLHGFLLHTVLLAIWIGIMPLKEH